jgi:non-specific serine/threonine protein kinase
VLAQVRARRQLLLVLDNCEHVIDAAAALCVGLLSACDDVRILATSRELLRTPGEAAFRLAPLSLPDPGDLAGAARAESVMLFTDRARAADASSRWSAGPSRWGAAGAALDGMPLAIRAAARVEALGVSQLLDLLGGGQGAAGRLEPGWRPGATGRWRPPHSGATSLLDQAERRVFRQVSVFPAPFTLEAAGAVAGPGAPSAVLRLVECSLLVPPQPGPDGRLRYRMRELRGHGASCWPKLESGTRQRPHWPSTH